MMTLSGTPRVDRASHTDWVAVAGSDYTATSGSLTFAPGETTKTVNVSVAGDVLFESNDVFKLVLSNAVNATLLTTPTQGIGTITNDDTAPAVSAALFFSPPITVHCRPRGRAALRIP